MSRPPSDGTLPAHNAGMWYVLKGGGEVRTVLGSGRHTSVTGVRLTGVEWHEYCDCPVWTLLSTNRCWF
jgi:hypothetical protein